MNPRPLLFAASLLACAAAARADVLKVPQQFATIPEAVTAVQSGDEIVISAGTYEGFDVDSKAGITIRGKGKVVIDGPTLFAPAGIVTLTNCNQLRVRGLRVVAHQMNAGFRFAGCTDCAVVDCRVENANTGIVSANSGGFSVEGCTTIGCDFGMTLDGAVGSRVIDCRVEQATKGMDCECESVEIRGCVVSGVEADGIDVSDSTTALVADNRLEDIGGTAIVVGTNAAVSIAGNTVKDAANGVLGVAAIAVIDNRFDDVAGTAIDCKAPGDTTAKNRIRRAGKGIVLESTADSGIHSKNSMKKCTNLGFEIQLGATGCLLVENVAKKSGDFDLSDQSGGDNSLIGNKFGTIGLGP